MGVAPGVFLMEDVDQAFELDLLVDLIRMSIEPESWDSDRASLVCSGAGSGWIMAGNTRKITAEARQLVLTAEVQVKRTLRISAQLYSVPTESLSGAGAMLASGPRPDAKVLARIGKLPGARNVTGLTLNAVSGAWVCGQAGLTRNYVLGYDVEVAQESRISDPLIGQVFDGLLVNARPVLSTSGREVKMRIGFRLASVDEASLTEARRTGSEINGVMHHPRERTLRYNGTVTLPLGGCHILDGGADLTEEGRRYVIVLEAR